MVQTLVTAYDLIAIFFASMALIESKGKRISGFGIPAALAALFWPISCFAVITHLRNAGDRRTR